MQAGNELVAVMDAAASLTAGNAAVSFDMDKLRVATPEMAVYLDHPWSAARMCAKAMSYVVMIVFGRIVFFLQQNDMHCLRVCVFKSRMGSMSSAKEDTPL